MYSSPPPRDGHWHIRTSMDVLVPLLLLVQHTHVAVEDAQHELSVIRHSSLFNKQT